MSKVAVVLLNWNGEKYLRKFLPALLENSPEAQIYVIDNASGDNSLSYLREHHPEVGIIAFSENKGFCGGYNEGLKSINADYYLLLNTDVEVTPGWLKPLLNRLDKEPEIAACQPKLKSYHHPSWLEYAGAAGGFIDRLGYPFCRGRIFDVLEKDEGQYDDEADIFWASGASMLIRSECFWEAGGFDETFFAHMEEIDLCWRLKNRGYRIAYTGHSAVYHVGGGTLPQDNPFKTYLNFRNGLMLLYKNVAPAQSARVLLERTFLDFTAALYFVIQGKGKSTLSVLKAHVFFWRNRQLIRSKRKQNFKTGTCYHHREILPFSIVWQFFIKKKRRFKDLWN